MDTLVDINDNDPCGLKICSIVSTLASYIYISVLAISSKYNSYLEDSCELSNNEVSFKKIPISKILLRG